jgi:hypothetical protein
MNIILVWGISAALLILTSYLWGWVVWGKIFEKAGYSRSKGLTMVFPVINVVILIVFAFSDWPVCRRLRYATPESDSLPAEMS